MYLLPILHSCAWCNCQTVQIWKNEETSFFLFCFWPAATIHLNMIAEISQLLVCVCSVCEKQQIDCKHFPEWWSCEIYHDGFSADCGFFDHSFFFLGWVLARKKIFKNYTWNSYLRNLMNNPSNKSGILPALPLYTHPLKATVQNLSSICKKQTIAWVPSQNSLHLAWRVLWENS